MLTTQTAEYYTHRDDLMCRCHGRHEDDCPLNEPEEGACSPTD